MRISDWSSDVCSSDLSKDGAAPAKAEVPSKAAPKDDKQVDDTRLALPTQLERKYLRVGNDLFRSGRDDKPDMSIKGQDGIRINKDYAIGDRKCTRLNSSP